MRAAVITAIYGRYDTLKPVCPQDGADVDWVLVTDDPDIRDGTGGWRVVHDPQPGVHPNRAAKQPKFFPWRFADAPVSVWIDASYQVTSLDFVVQALTMAQPLAQFTHPWRDCCLAEASYSAGLAKYAGEPLAAQVAAYRRQGHPEHWGLWAGGVIARQHTPEMRILGEAWQGEVDVYSFQDQVSEPFVLRSLDLPRPAALPGTHLSNPWLAYQGSDRH